MARNCSFIKLNCTFIYPIIYSLNWDKSADHRYTIKEAGVRLHHMRNILSVAFMKTQLYRKITLQEITLPQLLLHDFVCFNAYKHNSQTTMFALTAYTLIKEIGLLPLFLKH